MIRKELQCLPHCVATLKLDSDSSVASSNQLINSISAKISPGMILRLTDTQNIRDLHQEESSTHLEVGCKQVKDEG